MKLPPCQPAQCKTCIFREDGKQLDLAPGRLDQIKAYLIRGTPHRCHGPALAGKRTKIHCRGGRDFQLMIWARLGIIPEPTDAALAEAMANVQPRSRG
jgi:hypothetical protein